MAAVAVAWPSIAIAILAGAIPFFRSKSFSSVAGVMILVFYCFAAALIFMGPIALAARHLPPPMRTRGPLRILRHFGTLPVAAWCINLLVVLLPPALGLALLFGCAPIC